MQLNGVAEETGEATLPPSWQQLPYLLTTAELMDGVSRSGVLQTLFLDKWYILLTHGEASENTNTISTPGLGITRKRTASNNADTHKRPARQSAKSQKTKVIEEQKKVAFCMNVLRDAH